jgi:dienelactone hydrolase
MGMSCFSLLRNIAKLIYFFLTYKHRGAFMKIFRIAALLAFGLAFSATKQLVLAQESKPVMQFANQLSQGQFNQAVRYFDSTMTAALPAAKLAQVWQALSLSNGKFQAFGAARSENLGAYKVYFVPSKFAKTTLDLKVVLNNQNMIAGFFIVPHTEGYKPPAYAPAGAFTNRPTKVVSGQFSLDALWTVPKGQGAFPCVILVHGSGPLDKDESIGPNKPFKDLAEGLAARGIAVLRYEKRTKQYGKQMDVKNVTVQEETVEDAVAAVNLARTAEFVEPSSIFVLGHSLGGTLVPRIAKQAEGLRGCIVMAGAARPLEDLLFEQTDYLSRVEPSTEAQKLVGDLKEKVRLVKSDALTLDTPAEQLPMGVPAKYWLDLKGYDPVAQAKEVTVPLLVLQGGRDYQVTASGDFRRWQEGLQDTSRYTLKFYPKLSHLFTEGEGMATPAEYLSKTGHVSSVVIEDISNWVKKQN